MTSKILKVEGMSCNHCKAAVTQAVSALKGVAEVEVSVEEKKVKIKYDDTVLPLDRIKQVILGQGYQVIS